MPRWAVVTLGAAGLATTQRVFEIAVMRRDAPASRTIESPAAAHGFAFSRLSPDGATASALAEHLGITKQAAGQMVDYLQGRGYVTRVANVQDRRVKLVCLTDRGRGCIELGIQTMDAIAAEWAERAGCAPIATTRAALRAVLAGEDPASSPGLRPAW